jgi:putative membrane protein
MDLSRFVPALINSVAFSVIGVFTFLLCFFIVDKLTPGNLWQELVEKKNTAVGIFFGFIALGMSLIIAACLHG